MSEADDIALIKARLFSPCALELKKMPPKPGLQKTPDLQIISRIGFEGFCEVKSPQDPWLDELLEHAEPDQIVGGLRPDPTFNRIARQIQKAVKQFDAVNPDKTHPNVLVLVNHDEASGFADFHETLTGYFQGSDGKVHSTVMHISEHRLGDVKHQIDLYIWIDAAEHRGTGWFFSGSNPAHEAKLKKLFKAVRPRDD